MSLGLVEPALQTPPGCQESIPGPTPWLDVNCADSAPVWTLG
jgi:hypothetical protein